MKKLFTVLLVFATFISYSQEKNQDFNTKKHEFKAGGIKLIAGPILETTYEYIQSKNFTFGTSLLINLNSDDFNEDFSLTPFARFYFQETKEYGAYGFFVEGFGKIATGNDYFNEYNNGNANDDDNYTAVALGLSAGRKWINTSGFVVETLFGVGRTLGNSNNAPEAFVRWDLFIGYRFK